MSIIRSNDAPMADTAAESRGRDNRRDPQRPVEPESRLRFQQLMQRGHQQPDAGDHAARSAGDGSASVREQRGFPEMADSGQRPREAGAALDILPPAELAAMWQAQHLVQQAPGTTTALPTPAVNSSAFADMLERHVRQLAISDSAAGGEDGQVLLRMADSTLPGTDLLLSRTADGWLLRADVRSRDSFDAIREAGGRLSERFAQRGLGTLSIDPHLHD